MNKIPYRYTPFVAEVKASAASNDIYQNEFDQMLRRPETSATDVLHAAMSN